MLADKCKYGKCTHTKEPGCAVLEAVKDGLIPERRLENYHKLKREIEYNLSKHEARFRNKRSNFWKNVGKQAKLIKKSRGEH
ncbi:MAG: hypothetical protein JW778_07140 [Candidatus Altiarchaeota archaeon]|nr:hypothetical protein [Candidatus Altiarchaeota archaeon]